MPSVNNKVADIKKSLTTLKWLLNEQALSDSTKEFFKDYIYFVFNWNNNIARDKDIYADCNLLMHYIDLQFTVKDLIIFGKELVRDMRAVKQIEPASIQLSRHYLASLAKE